MIGINVRAHQLLALALAGFFAGVAGSLFVVVDNTVFPDMLASPEFDAKTLVYFLACFHAQADHIPSVYSRAGNHRLGELCMNKWQTPE